MLKRMFKKTMIVALLVSGFAMVDMADANAWVVRRRFAPVRTAARVVLPPYRRRVVYAAPAVYAAPVYRAPVVYGYGPRVHVGVGW